MRARETAQRLGALAVLAKDTISNTYMSAYNQFQGIQYVHSGKNTETYIIRQILFLFGFSRQRFSV